MNTFRIFELITNGKIKIVPLYLFFKQEMIQLQMRY
jgi:hypothetical protein